MIARYSLAVCTQINNVSTHHIFEWYEYYCMIGVDHFYIYTNNTKVPILLDKPNITYILTDKFDNIPSKCLQSYGKDNTWIAFFDLHHFVVAKTMGIKQLLNTYSQAGALAVCGYNFAVPNKTKTLLDQNIMRESGSGEIRMIVHAKRILHMNNNYVEFYVDNYHGVDENNNYFISNGYINSNNIIQLNCYYSGIVLFQGRRDIAILLLLAKLGQFYPKEFDYISYLIYNNLAKHGATVEWALQHWYDRGREQRLPYSPKIEFNWQIYLKCNPDLLSAGICTFNKALEHFASHGRQEGRKYHLDTR